MSSSTISGSAGHHGGGNAGLEVVAEHEPAGTLELALNGRELLHDVGAVGVLLDHAQHGVEVSRAVRSG